MPTAETDHHHTIHTLYDFISEHLYLSRPDLEVGGEKFNSALLLSLLTALLGGKELVIGEPGLGKTTSAEYVCALLYRIPLGVLWGSEVAGHPEQTEEKMIGRPDLGKLNRGEEQVVWSNFVQLPVKIIDEINRLPETKQSLILDGVDRGNWEYLNQILLKDEYCLFATANYQDQGTQTLIPPLLDRFDVIVESKHPGANLSFFISQQEEKKDNVLRDPECEREFYAVLLDKAAPEGKETKLEEMGDRFAGVLRERHNLTTLKKDERRALRATLAGIEFSAEASAFTRTALTELSFCCTYGQKRSNEECPEGCHYSGYLCYQVRNCASNRLPTSLRRYAQALAWLLSSAQVEAEHVRCVLPFVLAHRVQWRDTYVSAREREARRDPLPLHLAKQAVADIWHRFSEQREQILGALAQAARILAGADLRPLEGDHPIFVEIKRDLGGDQLW
ncbi:MAG TPA: AAA family ATPase [Candidatus Binatia bacterium]|nr:AAA family ATPase [Candidatus Binatia bacterium]